MADRNQLPTLITLCNQPVADDIAGLLTHVLIDVHEILRRLSEFEREARPLLDAYKRTNGGTIGLLKARRDLRNGA